jgi:malonate transporter and related proteins
MLWISHTGLPPRSSRCAGLRVSKRLCRPSYAQHVNFAQLLIPDFALILCGYLVCRHTALNRTVWQQVESLVYFFLFPVLLFQSIVKSPLDLDATSRLIAAGLVMALASIAMSYSLPHLPWLGRHIDARDHAASAQIAFRFNSFVALALAERLAGPQGLLLIAVLIGFCVPLFNVAAVWPMARHGRMGLAGQLLRNPLIIATLSGLAANLLGFSIPVWIEPAVTRIGAASLALGLMAAGAGMRFETLARAKALTVAVLGIRHLFTPLVAMALARLLRLDPAQTTVLLAFSALPTASSAYVLAARMGYNGPYVAGLVTLSTLLALASLPFALGVLR